MITLVKVYLDEEVPEYMAGIIRIGSVVSEDEKCNERSHEKLVDNMEFSSEDLLKQHVSNYLKVAVSRIEIVE